MEWLWNGIFATLGYMVAQVIIGLAVLIFSLIILWWITRE